ncbi:magnesium chelatase subunit H [Ideonella alba]|uniref:magnesium chelatase n=1 Tax=Ideonella alba TaxID=2824118 RepID=A0A940Y528_9BURK|nr:magnesium chelatase subunit H [Ideonella alba]MBQ0930354.1 magnesium chelatase subunit H [Ideonella alba]
MPRPTSAPESRTAGPAPVPLRVVLVTMDSHIASAAERAARELARALPGLRLAVHAASEWADKPAALARCHEDIAQGDIVIVTMLFMEDHFLPVLDALRARRAQCDAMVCAMSAAEVMKLTRMGRLSMDGQATGITALLKKLRHRLSGKGESEGSTQPSAGAQQMAMLRRLPQILRFIPGTAQDLRAYFLVLQYWLAGSQDNVASLVKLLVQRYASGPREAYRARAKPDAPVEYPEVGLYHPRMQPALADQASALPAPSAPQGTVGLLLLRSYLLAGNTAHYDGVISALEARGLRVLPAFATGLDARPAVEKFFLADGRPCVDSVVSLTGFSLVGGPAYNDARAAEDLLARLDVPYLSVMPVEFQTLEQWGGSERGLLPVEATMMVALPELDGATGAMVYGGRSDSAGHACHGCARGCTFRAAADAHDMQTCPERADMLAARVARLVALRRSQRAQRRVACVLFNFPPNAGNTGTAAFLSVFESLHNLLLSLQQQGYTVEVPPTPDALRERIIFGNAERLGASANVHARIPTDDHVRQQPWLAEIESQWGPAPGRIQSDGSSIHVLGERFGNVFVGIQPGMGYEGDPMRLLFEHGFAPTHAFAAFYRWLREDFRADAVLHFGTHGALEFMPGKQAGLSGACWPDRLIGELPNFYLYASNNPSEGTIAKRRAAATLISYLTPPVSQAGLYRELGDLKVSLQRWRALDPSADAERAALAALVQAQAQALEMAQAQPDWADLNAPAQAAQADRLWRLLLETETTLIPHGLHVVGRAPSPSERLDFLQAMSAASAAGGGQEALPREVLQAVVDGRSPAQALADAGLPADDARRERLEELARAERLLAQDHEIGALLHALDGGYVRPAPGSDVVHDPSVLPTGRNLHGFDPFRLPSTFAVIDGARQADRLLARHQADGHPLPETVALVLWGTDNLKTEGAPIAQALALLGARPRFDGYGRLAGAELRPLAELGRPRIDVVVTLSGIFRDLLPLQIKLLAEAAFLAASADEPPEQNFVRRHALAFQQAHGGSLEDAALRVFGNAEGAYGANVNMLIDNSRWDGEDELAETYTRRKGFAYGRSGRPAKHPALLGSVLADVSLAYQNLDSVELGVTTIDTYFDTLGGISRAVARAKREAGRAEPGDATAPVYIGDATRGEGTVRTLNEQVMLETRTRMLNPKWYEGLLAHGYEGVRQIETAITNTMGWSATTGQVAPWVYQQLTRTFMLDEAMRDRLATLNPHASAKVAQRLLEAHTRRYWTPDADMLAALQRAGEELEDRLEGIFPERAAA